MFTESEFEDTHEYVHIYIYTNVCRENCAYLAIFSSQPWLCVLLWFLLAQIVRHSPLQAVAIV